MVKARNAGEAAWAKKQGRSFKDQRAREAFKTKVGFRNNNQKRMSYPVVSLLTGIDFRDPLCKFFTWLLLTCSAITFSSTLMRRCRIRRRSIIAPSSGRR